MDSIAAAVESLRIGINKQELTRLRLSNWKKTVAWCVDDDCHLWRSNGSEFEPGSGDADIVLRLSTKVLSQIVEDEIPFFIALWATGEIVFEGSFSDAYHLGYLFLSDNRSRKVVFLAHCFMNMNPRFPEGAAYPGACTPLIQTLMDAGVGIIQMPCAEFQCLGPEKELYGELSPDELRDCFRKLATGVVDDIEAYLSAGFEIAGIIGMNPSPSCGVEVTKGKETMLGTGRSTDEKPGSGVFIEETLNVAESRGLSNLPVFGVRRMLRGESGMDERLADVKRKLNSATDGRRPTST